jgi:hypothetical protein
MDLYFDEAGRIVRDSELRALGIAPKHWARRVIIADSMPVTAPKAAPPPVPASASRAASLPAVVLPAPDVEKARREDAEGLEGLPKGVRRIGVVQDLASPVHVRENAASIGEWAELPHGRRVWAALFLAEGAVGQRLHLGGVRLPAGAQAMVYNAGQPDERYTVEIDPDGEAWTATCFSERVVLEVTAPAGAAVNVSVDRAVYLYTGPGDWSWDKAAGTCTIDVSCHGDWADLSYGVGGLGTVGRLGYLWCTGTLLADRDPETDIPYFLTANHCVEDQAAANSLEVYWLYQTTECGGTAAHPRTAPRTAGGAEYVAGATYASGPDFTLLRLRGAVPAGVAFVGWDSGSVPDNNEVVGIHHPAGDYKRISFGRIDAGDGTGLPSARFHSVRWFLGVTEPGSSGSPLFAAESRRLIGQLYGGGASCAYPNEPDYFGRFDQTFPIVQSYLGDTVRLVRPNGGEYWASGEEVRIEWFSTPGLNTSVRIDLLRNGTPVTTIAEDTNTSQSFRWRVPANLPYASDYAVAITPASRTVRLDTSDAFFAVGPEVLITGLSPSSGYAIGGEEVVIKGRGFAGAGDLSVFLGGAPVAQIEVMSDTELRCLTPLHLPGPVAATLTNAWGGGAALENAFTFVEVSPAPQVDLDANRDGETNAIDLQLVINAVLGGPGDGCDVNRDGRVDSMDIQAAVLAAIALR